MEMTGKKRTHGREGIKQDSYSCEQKYRAFLHVTVGEPLYSNDILIRRIGNTADVVASQIA